MTTPSDAALIRRDKYHNDPTVDITADLARVAAGEPLAYVIGWIPFLGVRIALDSHPLIPRPETEWWTEQLIAHLKDRFGTNPFTLLDLGAGSGAIGIAVLAHLPHAQVWFVEQDPAHSQQIRDNLTHNNLAPTRTTVCTGDLFAPLGSTRFDIIASNPPYIPDNRPLDASVADFEPAAALFSGTDGLTLIRRIAATTPDHLMPGGELWLECDTTHTAQVQALLTAAGAADAAIHTDLYGRPRLVVGYYK